jgi:carbamoylphosphate synthase large subunit
VTHQLPPQAVLAGPAGLRRPDRIIVYGRAWPSWRAALSAEAAVWSRLPGVRVVINAWFTRSLRAIGGKVRAESVVIPVRERFSLRCPTDCWRLVAPPKAIRTFADKRRFARFAAAAGLEAHVPALYRSAAEAQYPCVLKRVDLYAGHGIAVVDSASELRRRRGERKWRWHRVLLQHYIADAHDRVTHCVCRDGRIVWHCTYHYELEPGARVQSPTTIRALAREEATAEQLALFERFLAPVGYEGPAAIDYRHRPDGSVVLLEINARFGASLMRPEHLDDLRGALDAVIAHARPPQRRQ